MNQTPTPWRVETNAEYVELDEGEELIVYSIVGPGPQEKSIVVTDNGHYGPSIDDAQFIIKAVNSYQAMKEALELYLEASIYLNGEMEEKIPALKKARTLGYRALALANGEDKEP